MQDPQPAHDTRLVPAGHQQREIALSRFERLGYDAERVDLIKRTIAKGASDDELEFFLAVAKRSGLDPFLKQIYAVMRYSSDAGRNVMSIQTGIDGLRLAAARSGEYAGSDPYQYGQMVDDEKDGVHPETASAIVYRITQGHRYPTSREVRWAEFAGRDSRGGITSFWKRMPTFMLGKVAEAHALRAAFPFETASMYIPEEMDQADNPLPPAGHTVHGAQRRVTVSAAESAHAVDADTHIVSGPTWDTILGDGAWAYLKKRARALADSGLPMTPDKFQAVQDHYKGDTGGAGKWLAGFEAHHRPPADSVPEPEPPVSDEPADVAAAAEWDPEAEEAALPPVDLPEAPGSPRDAAAEAAALARLADAVLHDAKLNGRLEALGYADIAAKTRFAALVRSRGGTTIEDARVVCGQEETERARAHSATPTDALSTGSVHTRARKGRH